MLFQLCEWDYKKLYWNTGGEDVGGRGGIVRHLLGSNSRG